MLAIIIDSNVDTRRLIRYLLQKMEFNVQEYDYGLNDRQLLNNALDSKPDLILIEVVPFQAKDWDIISKLRSKSGLERIPIIVTTTSNTKECTTMISEHGTTAVLFKPFNLDTFHHCIISSLKKWVKINIENMAGATEQGA